MAITWQNQNQTNLFANQKRSPTTHIHWMLHFFRMFVVKWTFLTEQSSLLFILKCKRQKKERHSYSIRSNFRRISSYACNSHNIHNINGNKTWRKELSHWDGFKIKYSMKWHFCSSIMKIHCGFVVVVVIFSCFLVYPKTSLLSRHHNGRSFSSSKRIEGSSSDDEDKSSSTSDSHSSDEKSKGDDKGKYYPTFYFYLKRFESKQK